MTTTQARCAAAAIAIGLTMGTLTAGAAAATPAAAPTDHGAVFTLAGGYPRVEAGPDGKPRMECNQFHDGERVSTSDSGRERKFICMFHDPLFSSGYWVWTELTLG